MQESDMRTLWWVHLLLPLVLHAVAIAPLIGVCIATQGAVGPTLGAAAGLFLLCSLVSVAWTRYVVRQTTSRHERNHDEVTQITVWTAGGKCGPTISTASPLVVPEHPRSPLEFYAFDSLLRTEVPSPSFACAATHTSTTAVGKSQVRSPRARAQRGVYVMLLHAYSRELFLQANAGTINEAHTAMRAFLQCALSVVVAQASSTVSAKCSSANASAMDSSSSSHSASLRKKMRWCVVSSGAPWTVCLFFSYAAPEEGAAHAPCGALPIGHEDADSDDVCYGFLAAFACDITRRVQEEWVARLHRRGEHEDAFTCTIGTNATLAIGTAITLGTCAHEGEDIALLRADMRSSSSSSSSAPLAPIKGEAHQAVPVRTPTLAVAGVGAAGWCIERTLAARMAALSLDLDVPTLITESVRSALFRVDSAGEYCYAHIDTLGIGGWDGIVTTEETVQVLPRILHTTPEENAVVWLLDSSVSDGNVGGGGGVSSCVRLSVLLYLGDIACKTEKDAVRDAMIDLEEGYQLMTMHAYNKAQEKITSARQCLPVTTRIFTGNLLDRCNALSNVAACTPHSPPLYVGGARWLRCIARWRNQHVHPEEKEEEGDDDDDEEEEDENTPEEDPWSVDPLEHSRPSVPEVEYLRARFQSNHRLTVKAKKTKKLSPVLPLPGPRLAGLSVTSVAIEGEGDEEDESTAWASVLEDASHSFFAGSLASLRRGRAQSPVRHEKAQPSRPAKKLGGAAAATGYSRSNSNSSSPSSPLLQAEGSEEVVSTVKDKKGRTYHVTRRHVIGQGGFACVFLGMAEDGSLVAVKAIPLPTTAAPSHQRAALFDLLVEEVSVLSSLRHENIVPYHGSSVTRTSLMIVMEYISGGSLGNLLAEFGSIRPKSLRRYCCDILRGLAFLHEKGIIHRDIKPQNVLVSISGTCKLTDFGTSTVIGSLKHTTQEGGAGGALVGTPVYMAPEQCRGEALTPAADVWSFGIMVAELACGKVPYAGIAGGIDPGTFLYRLGKGVNMTPTLDAAMDPSVKEMVERCLVREAEKRATIAQLLACPFLANGV